MATYGGHFGARVNTCDSEGVIATITSCRRSQAQGIKLQFDLTGLLMERNNISMDHLALTNKSQQDLVVLLWVIGPNRIMLDNCKDKQFNGIILRDNMTQFSQGQYNILYFQVGCGFRCTLG